MLIKKTIILCKKTIIFNTISLFFVFLLLGFLATEYITNQYYKENTEFFDKDFYITSITSYHCKEKEFKKQLIDINGDTVECWYVNQNYCNNLIKLNNGRKLNYDNTSEVLLCGEKLQKKYKINDKILINNKMYSIVGKVNNNLGLVDLSFSYLQKDYVTWIDNLYDLRNSELVITNDNNFSDNPILGLSKIATQKTANSTFFRDISENTRKEIKKKTYFNQALVIILFLFSLFSIISNKITEVIFLGEYLSIYKLCGLTKTKCILTSMVVNLIHITLSFVMYILVFTTIDRYNETAIYNLKNTLPMCLIFSIIFVFVSVFLDIRKQVK